MMLRPPFPVVWMSSRWREELPGTLWRWLLAPAWLAYAVAVGLRNTAYNRGWLRVERAAAPVFSVGNIVAGGAGKTPAALALARLLIARGRRPMVLSRGYRGDGITNDEALLAPDVRTICDPDRVRGARTAIAAGANCLVLDDGFQHRRLHRDLDLVVIDATRPWGDPAGGPGAMLPLGWRREPLCALSRAQVAWISRGHLVPDRGAALAVELTARGLTVVREATPERRLVDLSGATLQDALRPDVGPVILVSGIGNPLGFELDARDLGLAVAVSLRFPDHHRYTKDDLDVILLHVARHTASAVVITAKDAVKLAGVWPAGFPPCLVLQASTSLESADTATLAAAVDRVLA